MCLPDCDRIFFLMRKSNRMTIRKMCLTDLTIFIYLCFRPREHHTQGTIWRFWNVCDCWFQCQNDVMAKAILHILLFLLNFGLTNFSIIVMQITIRLSIWPWLYEQVSFKIFTIDHLKIIEPNFYSLFSLRWRWRCNGVHPHGKLSLADWNHCGSHV